MLPQVNTTRRSGHSPLLYDVLDHVLRYVRRQYRLQAIQNLVGVQHVGLVTLALRPAPERVHDVEQAASPPLEIFFDESGGRHAHHRVHACWLQLAGLRVAQQELVAVKDVLDHLLGVRHWGDFEQGQVSGGDYPECLDLVTVVSLRVTLYDFKKFREGTSTRGFRHYVSSCPG